MVGADEGDDAALDDRDRLPPVPDILADQRAGALVVLGDPPSVRVEDGVDGDGGGGPKESRIKHLRFAKLIQERLTQLLRDKTIDLNALKSELIFSKVNAQLFICAETQWH